MEKNRIGQKSFAQDSAEYWEARERLELLLTMAEEKMFGEVAANV